MAWGCSIAKVGDEYVKWVYNRTDKTRFKRYLKEFRGLIQHLKLFSRFLFSFPQRSHSILHLLPSIPSLAQPTSPTSSTGTGFTDLPSDAEDTFFFSGSEDEVSYQQYERAKKRRKVEMGREERLRAMEEGVRDGRVKGIDNEETEEKAEDGWISDEEVSGASLASGFDMLIRNLHHSHRKRSIN